MQTGDIVDIIAVGNLTVRAPFKNGKTGVQKILHECYKSKDTSIRVRVRRGSGEFAELVACIVPNESGGRKQYLLRSMRDPNYAVGFVDRTEAECLNLQGNTHVKIIFSTIACIFKSLKILYFYRCIPYLGNKKSRILF